MLYVYDARNQRVKRTGKDGTTVYAYGRQGALAWQKNVGTGNERTYAYALGTIIGWTETKAGAEARVSIGDIFPKNIGRSFPLFW